VKVIYFEGLFGLFGRWLYRGLIKDLKKAHPKVKFESRSWLFSRKVIEDLDTVVIGHSFGAAKALKLTKNCYALILLDCRNAKGENFRYKPRSDAKSFRIINFHQTVGLDGYEVDDAYNVTVTGTSHGRLPWHEDVHHWARDIIGVKLNGNT
jgi:hypothetical protein